MNTNMNINININTKVIIRFFKRIIYSLFDMIYFNNSHISDQNSSYMILSYTDTIILSYIYTHMNINTRIIIDFINESYIFFYKSE